MSQHSDDNHQDKSKPDQGTTAIQSDDILDAEYLDEPEEEPGKEPAAATERREPAEGESKPAEPDETYDEEDDDIEEYEDDIDDYEEDDEDEERATASTTEEEGTKTEPAAAAAAEPVARPKNIRWDTMFLLLLCCITLIRLGYLYVAPFDLGHDESYQWDWSRNLALGYYSKPPLIAWVHAASTALLGISPFAVRLPAIVFGAIGLIGFYLCGRRMFNGEVAFWAVAAWLATPGMAALGVLMTPDVLLICFWCLALYTLWRAVDSQGSGAFWWLLTMLFVGLGSLGKQMMLIFPPLMLTYLLFSEDRKWLKTKWPWLTWFGSLLFLLPPLWWNVQNGWITFKHTAGHVEPLGTSVLDHFKTFAEFVGGQMVMLTPVTWLLLMLLLASLLLKLLRWSKQTKFLFLFSGLGLFAFVIYSFKQEANMNWPGTFYPAGILLLAAWGRGQVSAGFFDGLRTWFPRGIKFGVALTLLVYLLTFVLQLSFIPLGKIDPLRRNKGWQELGAQVGETLQQQPRPEQTFVLSPLRKYSAEVAFYMPGHPTTYKWPGNPPRINSQYELWPGPVDKLGWDALILHNADANLPADLAAAFENVVELGERSIPIGAAGERKYRMWRGENLLFWPEQP